MEFVLLQGYILVIIFPRSIMFYPLKENQIEKNKKNRKKITINKHPSIKNCTNFIHRFGLDSHTCQTIQTQIKIEWFIETYFTGPIADDPKNLPD